MNIKRNIGAFLTMLGIAGLIFALIFFLASFGGHDDRIPITSGLLSVIFFSTGLAMVNATDLNNRT